MSAVETIIVSKPPFEVFDDKILNEFSLFAEIKMSIFGLKTLVLLTDKVLINELPPPQAIAVFGEDTENEPFNFYDNFIRNCPSTSLVKTIANNAQTRNSSTRNITRGGCFGMKGVGIMITVRQRIISIEVVKGILRVLSRII